MSLCALRRAAKWKAQGHKNRARYASRKAENVTSVAKGYLTCVSMTQRPHDKMLVCEELG